MRPLRFSPRLKAKKQSSLGFSLGVEPRNQLVILPLYSGLQLLKQPRLLLLVQRYASGAVALGGLYYLFIDLFDIF